MDNVIENAESLSSISTIDKTIHEPARLMILAFLFIVESADYVYLVDQTGMTWGNLSSHIGKLEDAGFVEVKKEFVNKKPHTMLAITDQGREAFQAYREKLEQLLQELPE